MNPDFYSPTSYKYLGGVADVMEIRSEARAATSPVHFNHIDSNKSFLALQELQNEVGALLEFRDVVMEAFPQLRGKLAASNRAKWEPGIRVRKKLRDEGSTLSQPRSRSNSRSKGSSSSATVQDSGFCTQESKKAGDQEAEDELWNLLEVIHSRGTKLRLEVETLQERYGGRRSRSLEDIVGCTDDLEVKVRELTREKDLLLDRVTEMEAENLANLTQTNHLLAQVGALASDKRLLGSAFAPVEPRRLIAPVPHLPVSTSLDDLRPFTPPPSTPSSPATPLRTCHSESKARQRLGTLDGILTTPKNKIPCPKGVTPNKEKTAAILQETNLHELQRHLITTTHQVEVVHHRLEKVSKRKTDLSQQLEKVKEENEDLKFQLEEKSIELEGTRARVRLLERLQATCSSQAIVTKGSQHVVSSEGEEGANHCSSTESAHHSVKARQRRSKIPLKSVAPKPPSSNGLQTPSSVSSTTSGRSLARSVGPSLSASAGRQPSRSSSRESLRTTPSRPTAPVRSSARSAPDQDKGIKSFHDSLESSKEEYNTADDSVGVGGNTDCNATSFDLNVTSLDYNCVSLEFNSTSLECSLEPRPPSARFFDSIESNFEQKQAQADSLEISDPDLV